MQMTHIISAALLASLSLSGFAHAQNTRCGPRTAMVAQLTDQYGEVSHGAGLTNPQNLVEVWSSKSGSWTILSSNANGISCIVAAGKNWTGNPKFATAFDPDA